MLFVACAASKFILAHFIKNRRDIPNYEHAAINHIKHRMKHPLRELRSDNANEYTSRIMTQIYDKYGITHHLHTPHQPQENGIAERLNRTIMESVRALLHTAKLDDTYWEDAARDTIFKYNLMHHASTKTSPYRLWYNAHPKIKRMFTFGQLGTIPVYAPKKKLESRADPARYMYATTMTHVMTINLRIGTYNTLKHMTSTPITNRQTPRWPRLRPSKREQSTNNQRPPKSTSTPHHQRTWTKHESIRMRTTGKKLTTQNSIDFTGLSTPTPKSIIPVMMIYRYKRSAEGHIFQRKERCNLLLIWCNTSDCWFDVIHQISIPAWTIPAKPTDLRQADAEIR